jgi:hypothetical protein
MKLSSVNMLEVDLTNRNREIQVIMNIQSKKEIPPT